ncbi:MAG: hypothetical protein IJV56_06505 [Neisseriaceae bacterium]|nr:hypothetical protein [Neisseriaceae bacterium]
MGRHATKSTAGACSACKVGNLLPTQKDKTLSGSLKSSRRVGNLLPTQNGVKNGVDEKLSGSLKNSVGNKLPTLRRYAITDILNNPNPRKTKKK